MKYDVIFSAHIKAENPKSDKEVDEILIGLKKYFESQLIELLEWELFDEETNGTIDVDIPRLKIIDNNKNVYVKEIEYREKENELWKRKSLKRKRQ